MSQTVTGIQAPAAIGRVDGHTNYASLDFVVSNGVTVNAGDFVKFDGSGDVTSSSVTADRIVGLSEATVVGDGTKTATVCIDPNMVYLLESDSALSATDVGKYFDLTGSAGAQQISHSSGSTTTGAYVCLAVWTAANANQFGIQGLTTSYGKFKLVESALYPLGS